MEFNLTVDESYRIEKNVAMDVVVNVLGESQVSSRSGVVRRRQRNAVVATSPHDAPFFLSASAATVSANCYHTQQRMPQCTNSGSFFFCNPNL